MFASRLFLGFLLQETFANHLEKVDPRFVRFFIRQGSEYLEEALFKDQIYLGKFVKEPAHAADLELLQTHIYSLLKKLVPDYPYERFPLSLMPLLVEEA